jgi:UDP-N-acetylmuramate dehydrogenase
LPIWSVNEEFSKVSGAYLIDKVANLSGYKIGSASVSKKQSLVLINEANASSRDILMLAKKIKKTVNEKTGIKLEEEVCII